MRGNKTTAIKATQVINKILAKRGITNTSFGIIVSIKGRRDHRTSIKHRSESGCHLLTITQKRYKQEYRIYDDVTPEVIMTILRDNLGEQYRIL